MNTTNTNTEGLSARQVDSLRWVAKLGGGVTCHATTLRALERCGLVETSTNPFLDRLTATATDAGRAMLARIDARIGGQS